MRYDTRKKTLNLYTKDKLWTYFFLYWSDRR